MNIILLTIIALVSYFLGGVNGAIIISQAAYGRDIRNYGSGNAGANNMLRVHGGGAALMVVLVDVGKSVIAVLIGNWLFGYAGYPVVGKLFAGFCLMLGHLFPVFYQLKGGRGVICGAVTVFLVDWKVGLVCLGIFVVELAALRYVSLGSILGAIAFPIAIWLMPGHTSLEAALSLCSALLVIFKHSDNIGRLVTGRESKISVGSRKDS